MPPDRGGDRPETSLWPPTQHHIAQPSPRNPRHGKPALFTLTPLSTSSSSHSSPDDSSAPQSPQDASPISPQSAMPSDDLNSNGSTTPPPTKSRSILNLTSSTLLGIYSSGGYDANRDESDTPWGSGAQTPALRNGGPGNYFDTARSLSEGLREKTLQQLRDPSAFSSVRSSFSASPPSHTPAKRRRKPPTPIQTVFAVLWRAAALFLLGVAYGTVVTHLHDSREIAPVKVDINRSSWRYLGFWGLLGIVLGFMLPAVDEWWGYDAGDASEHEHEPQHTSSPPNKAELDMDRHVPDDADDEHSGAEWNPIVRSVGAFVGIAFAIRRLPWQSTLQVSLTLALVNPVIWYLLDRTPTGVALSLVTAVTGATAMMGINPDIVPPPTPSPAAAAAASRSAAAALSSPSSSAVLGLSMESIGVATWIGSVFFCSCVCFGNVGRRLARGVA